MAWELTQSANYAVVNSQFGYGGLNSRHNAEVSYTSPNWGGLNVTVGHLFAANNGNVAKNDVNLIYRAGPLSAALVYNKLDNKGKKPVAGCCLQLWQLQAGRQSARRHRCQPGQGLHVGWHIATG
jgi:predicted porin